MEKNELIFLAPVFQDKIWGGDILQSWFPNDHLSDTVGECWSISAHPHGVSKVSGGTFNGLGFDVLYKQHPELFGLDEKDEQAFPLLVKILAPTTDLSVQVHPDDEYGLRVEGEYGKTECWYILDCEPDAKIIYGHEAQTKEEFAKLIRDGKWSELLTYVPVKKGDFFYVPSGTIHALTGGVLVLEVQQSSDTTYRLYDYDRVDDNGEKRELHIEKSIDVTMIPHVDAKSDIKEKTVGTSRITTLVSNEFFTVTKVSVADELIYKRTAPYASVTIVDGSGEVNGKVISKGESFMIPNSVEEVNFVGKLEVIIASL